MFTEPPPLAERVSRIFDSTRVVDISCDIDPGAPCSTSLAELIAQPFLVRELRSVGANVQELTDTNRDPVDRVRALLPSLAKIRNTSASWRLFRILNDLYDYTRPEILEDEVEALDAHVRACAGTADWARHVLFERSRIDHLVCDAKYRNAEIPSESCQGNLGARVTWRWDASSLLTYDHRASDAAKRVAKPAYTRKLAETIGQRPDSLDSLIRHVSAFLDRTVSGDVKLIGTRLSNKVRINAPDEGQIDHLLAQERGGVPLTEDETDQIVSAVAWAIFSRAAQSGKPICLEGAGRSPHQPYSCPASLGRLADEFSGLNLLLVEYSRDFARHAFHIAASRPNVYVGGHSDNSFVSAVIASECAERFQSVPAPKSLAFRSRATKAEWVYGNLLLLRQGLSRAIARSVEDDHFHENQAAELLESTLHRSSTSFLSLV